MIRAIIWDFGGVLVRTEDYSSRDELAGSLGKTSDELEFLLFAGESSTFAQSGQISYQQHVDNVRQSLGLSPDEMEEFLERFWKGDSLDNDLMVYIRSLKKRYKIGLLSNAFENLRKLITQHWKFEDAFDIIVVSAEVEMMKPDPRIYQLILKELNVEPSEAVFLDDVIQNIEAARSVGLHAIHFQSPQQARAELEKILNGA